MTRHAYLILAHNEFDMLQRLISALDDARNDIFVHIDAKVKELPSFHATDSGLYVLDSRMKTYWGDTSLMEAELALMQKAQETGDYEYYHIISGVHFPLKCQDELHAFFDGLGGESVLSYMDTSEREIRYKFARYHFFVKGQSGKHRKFFNFLWRLALVIQKPLPERNVEPFTMKRSQWCSLSADAVKCLTGHSEDALVLFKRTFCCDEFYVPTILSLNGVKWVDSKLLLYMKFRIYSPKVLDENDFDDTMRSGCMFARKFSCSNGLVQMIENTFK